MKNPPRNRGIFFWLLAVGYWLLNFPRCLSLSKAKRGASTSSATEEFGVQSHVVTTVSWQAVECESVFNLKLKIEN